MKTLKIAAGFALLALTACGTTPATTPEPSSVSPTTSTSTSTPTATESPDRTWYINSVLTLANGHETGLSEEQVIEVGESACRFYGTGAVSDRVDGYIEAQVPDASEALRKIIIVSAAEHICPQHADQARDFFGEAEPLSPPSPTVETVTAPPRRTTRAKPTLDLTTDKGICAADAELTNLELNDALAPVLGYPADRDLRTFDQDQAIRAYKNKAFRRACPERAS